MGVISLKIRREMSTVGFAPHHWMRGTKRRLEQLMTHCRFRGVSNSYEKCLTVSHVCKSEELVILTPKKSKPQFYPWIRGKIRNFEGLL